MKDKHIVLIQFSYQTIVGTPFLILSSQSSVNGRPCVTDVSRNGRSNNVLKPRNTIFPQRIVLEKSNRQYSDRFLLKLFLLYWSL
jgi:hypothetical protein